jgi:hypothetical protein
MTERALVWVGGTIAVAAATALGTYFTVVGLDKADKLASVVGAFVGFAGLVLSTYGLVSMRRDASPPSPAEPPISQRGAKPEQGQTHNTFSGGTVHGSVIMGRDVTMSGDMHQVLPRSKSSTEETTAGEP